ncbi:hypothetical protein L3081_19060 [Colwellia sp. MSW7]|uniref:Tetrapyrrole methylase domain-containing protein n=1 Tax=Colwellia maritima TaxID=2912588 RepID=A0ABS9X5Q2_9GAMM|nr:hypothetical protein [Colwellia maritima]
MPLTHRKVARSCTFITGNVQDNGALDLPWQTLNDEEQTVVFYMGIKSLPIITQQLVKVGRAMSTPAALIRKGTHANQQVIKGTIETLESLVILHHIKPPSLIVIGNVVDTFADSQLKNLGYLSPIDNK